MNTSLYQILAFMEFTAKIQNAVNINAMVWVINPMSWRKVINGYSHPCNRAKKSVSVLSKLRLMGIVILNRHKKLGVDISGLVRQELIYFIVGQSFYPFLLINCETCIEF